MRSLIPSTLFCLLFTLHGCKSVSGDVMPADFGNEIEITPAITHREEILLSEIVDSISFIPLETTNDNLIGTLNPIFTPQYIYHNNLCFDWDGNFIGSAGQKGRGPLEEMYGVFNLRRVNNHFYSLGSKLIEYDLFGKTTRKVKTLYSGSETKASTGRFSKIAEFTSDQENLLLYSYPDTLFFMNTNFELLSTVSVAEPINRDYYSPNPQTKLTRYMTDYNDTTIFYNFLNDTIYHVAGTSLTPAWIVKMDEGYKIPKVYFYNYRKLLGAAGEAWKSGNLEQCELIRISDNKPTCVAAYETSRYIFLITATVINFPVQRGLKKENDLYVIYYDKYTGKTRATKADGFQDDLLGFTSFMPLYGACKDKLIRILYPHQILDHIRQCNESGKKVDEKLLRLSQHLQENDNPILMMGHLKK